MDLMKGFCVEVEDRVSGVYGVVLEALLTFCVFGCIP